MLRAKLVSLAWSWKLYNTLNRYGHFKHTYSGRTPQTSFKISYKNYEKTIGNTLHSCLHVSYKSLKPMNDWLSGLTLSGSICSISLSRLGIQLGAKWQFWKNTHFPRSMALLIMASARGPCKSTDQNLISAPLKCFYYNEMLETFNNIILKI